MEVEETVLECFELMIDQLKIVHNGEKEVNKDEQFSNNTSDEDSYETVD